MAKLLRVPPIIIGLTVVGHGDKPCLNWRHRHSGHVGNNAQPSATSSASTIFNLIGGVRHVRRVHPLAIQRFADQRIPLFHFCGVLLLALGYAGMVVGFLDGVVLLALFAVYMIVMVRTALKRPAPAAIHPWPRRKPPWRRISVPAGGSVFCLLQAVCGHQFGGDFVVDGATTVAAALGLSQNLIGLTIVAVGTSLPGTGHLDCGCTEERAGYGAGKCNWLQYFQYPSDFGPGRCNQPGHIYF